MNNLVVVVFAIIWPWGCGGGSHTMVTGLVVPCEEAPERNCMGVARKLFPLSGNEQQQITITD